MASEKKCPRCYGAGFVTYQGGSKRTPYFVRTRRCDCEAADSRERVFGSGKRQRVEPDTFRDAALDLEFGVEPGSLFDPVDDEKEGVV